MIKFAVINRFEEVESIHHDYAGAKFYADNENNENDLLDESTPLKLKIQPVMTFGDYLKLSTDSRGFLRGKPAIAYYEPGAGTVYGPVYIIGTWDTWQHQPSRQELYKRFEEFIKSS